MSRIKFEMKTSELLIAMSEGNPGAVSVLMDFFKNTSIVDPQSALGGLGPIVMLDSLEIYGSDIWILYKDICGQDIAKTILLLRATQLGLMLSTDLRRAIESVKSYGNFKIDVDSYVAQVNEFLDKT